METKKFQPIALNINLTKISGAKLVKGKSGALFLAISEAKLFYAKDKGNVYLDATLLLAQEDDQYGNRGLIVERTTKEEREQAVVGNVLGNARIFVSDGKGGEPVEVEVDDDLPF